MVTLIRLTKKSNENDNQVLDNDNHIDSNDKNNDKEKNDDDDYDKNDITNVNGKKFLTSSFLHDL